ncbi:MAG: sugar transferase [Candidatus Rokubacteria bacterium]|nr:sugar transferase [Candidatus Rokubacteria bacterium]
MTTIVALLEGSSIFAAVCVTTLAWGHPSLGDWVGAGVWLAGAALLSLAFVVAFYVGDLYDLRVVPRLADYATGLPQSLGLAVVPLALASAWAPATQGPILASFLIVPGLLLPLRAVVYRALQHRGVAQRVLIVGATPLAWKLITEIETQPHLGFAIVGVADDGLDPDQLPLAYPLLGPLARLSKIIDEVRPHRIIVTLTERRGLLPARQLLESRVCGDVAVDDGVDVYERLTGKLAIEALTPSGLLFAPGFRKSRLALAMARVMSLLVAVVGLIALSPVLGLIALAIKVDSRGPVFFLHERVGTCGKRFKLLKFRTMHPAGRPRSEWARDNRDRITRVGRWLRRFRLDELPQFVNILRGEMNLVGPRPHPVSNFELFLEKIPYYSLRSAVLPGVTGWAQVRYRYANDLEEETEKMRYDLYYIKRMSLWLDLRILLETVKIVLVGRGAESPDLSWVEARRGRVGERLTRAA